MKKITINPKETKKAGDLYPTDTSYKTYTLLHVGESLLVNVDDSGNITDEWHDLIGTPLSLTLEAEEYNELVIKNPHNQPIQIYIEGT